MAKKEVNIVFKVRDEANAAFSKMNREMAQFRRLAQNLTAPFRAVLNQVFSLRTAVVGLFGVLAARAGARSFAGLLEDADAMGQLARQSGTTVEALSELRGAFEIARIPAGEFRSILDSVTRDLVKAGDGSDEAERKFEGLGLSLAELRGLEPTEFFRKIAEAVSGLSSEQDRLAALTRVFPQHAREMLTFLGQGADGFDRVNAKAKEFGYTISEQEAATGATFRASMLQLSAATESFGRALAASFGDDAAALMTGLAKLIRENRDEIVGMARDFAGALTNGVGHAVRAIIGLVEAIERIPTVDLVGKGDLRKQAAEIELQLRKLNEARNPTPPRRRPTITTDIGGSVSQNVYRRDSIEDQFIADVAANRERILAEIAPKEGELRAKLADVQLALTRGLAAVMRAAFEAAQAGAAAWRAEAVAMGREVSTPPPKTGGGDATTAPAPSAAPSILHRDTRDELRRWLVESQEMTAHWRANLVELDKAAALPRLQAALARGTISAEEFDGAIRLLTKSLDNQVATQRLMDQQGAIGAQQWIAQFAEDTAAAREQSLAYEKGLAEIQLRMLRLKELVTDEQFQQGMAAIAGNFQRKGDEGKAFSGDVFEGLSKGAREFMVEWTNATKTGQQAAQQFLDTGLNGSVDAISKAVLEARSFDDAWKAIGQNFKQVGQQMIQMLTQLITKLLLMQTIKAGASLLGLPIPALAEGGVVGGGVSATIPIRGRVPFRRFAQGGVAHEPTLALFGEAGSEAFVPLRGGKIPVELGGGGAGAGGTHVTVVMNVNTIDARSFDQQLYERKETLRNLVEDAVTRSTTMRQAVRSARR